jgi:hypothetical protein
VFKSAVNLRILRFSFYRFLQCFVVLDSETGGVLVDGAAFVPHGQFSLRVSGVGSLSYSMEPFLPLRR